MQSRGLTLEGGEDANIAEEVVGGAALGNVEYQSAETAAVEGAVWSQHLVAETRDDVVQSVAAGRHDVARYYVGIDNRHAELFEIMGHGGFAAADAAGETDDEHAASVRSAPRIRKRSSAIRGRNNARYARRPSPE